MAAVFPVDDDQEFILLQVIEFVLESSQLNNECDDNDWLLPA